MNNQNTQPCCPPTTQHVAKPTSQEETDALLAKLAKALGHPARVAIIRLLLCRQSCVCGDIVDVLPLAQSTVSQHLKILKEASLIRGDVDGVRVCYCIEPQMLALFKTLVSELDTP